MTVFTYGKSYGNTPIVMSILKCFLILENQAESQKDLEALLFSLISDSLQHYNRRQREAWMLTVSMLHTHSIGFNENLLRII